MDHRSSINKLGRNSAHRKALLKAQAKALFRYERIRTTVSKAKEARKRQTTISIKEIKLRPKIGDADYETKKSHVVRFLEHKDKVKVTIMFRGRELVHPERGEALLMRLAEDVKELGGVESPPNLDGRNMIMMLAPVK